MEGGAGPSRRSTEKPNGYRVVSGNVWPELTTAGTVMRPIVSDMGCGKTDSATAPFRSDGAQQMRSERRYILRDESKRIPDSAHSWC
jgi:hypothetical protein